MTTTMVALIWHFRFRWEEEIDEGGREAKMNKLLGTDGRRPDVLAVRASYVVCQESHPIITMPGQAQ